MVEVSWFAFNERLVLKCLTPAGASSMTMGMIGTAAVSAVGRFEDSMSRVMAGEGKVAGPVMWSFRLPMTGATL